MLEKKSAKISPPTGGVNHMEPRLKGTPRLVERRWPLDHKENGFPVPLVSDSNYAKTPEIHFLIAIYIKIDELGS